MLFIIFSKKSKLNRRSTYIFVFLVFYLSDKYFSSTLSVVLTLPCAKCFGNRVEIVKGFSPCIKSKLNIQSSYFLVHISFSFRAVWQCFSHPSVLLWIKKKNVCFMKREKKIRKKNIFRS